MKRILKAILGTFLFVQFVNAQTAVPPAAGDGTQANPYQIATLENLYWMATTNFDFTTCFVQTADINASETSNWFGGQGWTPIGISSGFYGFYNGRGHVIDSLSGAGLFGNNNGTIDSLGITHARIAAPREISGALVERNYGYIVYCHSSGSVGGPGDFVGGLVGLNSNGKILNSYSTADANGGGTVGGLVGSQLGGAVVNCYSDGSVMGANGAGGLIGSIATFSYLSTVYFCYSTRSVTGSGALGGLIGKRDDDSTLGFIFPLICNSYWDVETSGQSASAGGKGKTTAELQTPSLFVDACWNPSVWSLDSSVNHGYPYLSWQNPGGTPLPGTNVKAPTAGDGSQANPYRIATLENLYWLASDPTLWYGLCFTQVADINASKTQVRGDGEGWIPIGNPVLYFYGSYKGGGHIIDSLFISRPKYDYQGMFGDFSYEGIDSLGVTNLNIIGDDYVGGLCGLVFGGYSLTNSFSTGNVVGTGNYVGGLVGCIAQNGTMTDCYSKSSVSGVNYVGGLCGIVERSHSIYHFYSTGSVAGSGNVGGLIGQGGVEGHSFFGMNIGVTSSFWDIGTSGQAASSGGAGKTTLQMKTPATFSEAGWSGTLWCMDSTYNNGYPYLFWQNPNGTRLPLLPGFSISADTANFGTVPLNTSTEDSVLISDPGTDTLRITSIISTNKNFVCAQEKMSLAPSGSSYLLIMFTPQDTLTQAGYIILTHNTTGSPDTLVVSAKGSILTAAKSGIDLPTAYAISQNYPNPFNPTTAINYDIPQRTFVSVKIYDILGRDVAQIVNEVKQPGRYSVRFDGLNMSSGAYFYSITAGNFHQVKKMVLLK